MKYTCVLELITCSTNERQLLYMKGYLTGLKDCERLRLSDYEQLTLHIERKRMELEETPSSN